MATKGERQALLFLAAIALLGAGTRVWRAQAPVPDSSGIDRQLAAVDSSRVVGVSPAGRGRTSRRRKPADTTPAPGRIDLDQASAVEIERLPGIGPALAARIIAERKVNGAYGCLAALDVVKGIGPAMLRRIDTLALFSGAPREACFRTDDGRGQPSGRR